MADKLVAVRLKQQNNTYSNEIPIGAWAENVAYDNTNNLSQVLGTVDMTKGNIQKQLDDLSDICQDYIPEAIADTVDTWIDQHMPSYDPTATLDDTLTSSERPAMGSAVPKLIAVNESPIQGTKMIVDTTMQESEQFTVLTPDDIDATLSESGKAADALATSNLINGQVESLNTRLSSITGSLLPEKTLSGKFIQIPDAKSNTSFNSVKINIQPLQSGSGDQSLDNIRPIFGWNKIKLTQTSGKNFMTQPYDISRPPGYGTGSSSWTGISTNEDGIVTVSGRTFSTGGAGGVVVYNVPAGTYTLSFDVDYSGVVPNPGKDKNCAVQVMCRYYGADNNFSLYPLTTNVKLNHPVYHFTLTAPAQWLALRAMAGSNCTTESVFRYNNVQLERNLEATNYEPYNGVTFDINFPPEIGTVYGGVLDLTLGSLIVNQAYIASYNGELLPGKWISSIDVYSPDIDPSIGAQIVYELAQPITYQISSMQILVLEGQNNMQADCGSLEITYFQDVDARIMIAEKSGWIALHSFQNDEYIIIDGILYKTITSIEQGQELIPENNITQTIVGKELADLKKSTNKSDQLFETLINNYPDNRWIVDADKWNQPNNNYFSKIIPVAGKTEVICTANNLIQSRIAFINEYPDQIIAGDPINGLGNQGIPIGLTRKFIIPNTCTHIVLSVKYGGINSLPDSLIIDGVEYIKPLNKIASDINIKISQNNTSVIQKNISKDTAVRATGMKAFKDDILPLSFIHLSDMHSKVSDYQCFEHACEFCQYYNNIKFIIANGDLIYDSYADPMTAYNLAISKTTKPVLNVIGNHDAGQYKENLGLASQSTDKQCYDKYIAPYVANWGVVQPSNAAIDGKSYYYKDFETEKIRLIVLNEFETDYVIWQQKGVDRVDSREYRAMRQAQVSWLINVLNSTPSDYGVMVAYHQPDELGDEDNDFVTFNLTTSERATHKESRIIAQVYCSDYEERKWLPKILNAFATKTSLTLTVSQNGAVTQSTPTLNCNCDFTNIGAEFICILNGHTHKDYVGHLAEFPALKVLCVGACNLLTGATAMPRQLGTPSEDLFNVVNIDRNRKTIKIIRIGSNVSPYGQVRDQMIMSYVN